MTGVDSQNDSDPKFGHPAQPPIRHPRELDKEAKVKFRGWRLLGVIFIVVVVLAGISAVIDILVIGPLDGRL